jgi:hypothetical protein
MKTKQFYLISWLLLVVPSIVQAQFTFTTNSDDTITLTQYTGSNNVVVIPAATNGYPVTSLGYGSFSSTNIISVTIPGSVTSIGDEAFAGCNNLAGITFPGSLTNIGIAAFNSCWSLTNVSIPANVANIGDYAFVFCTNLTAINVDAANQNYSSADGVLFNKDLSILRQFPSGKSGSYSIPGTVISLADEAFGVNDYGYNPFDYSSCAGLTNLTIPNSITNIGDYAFSHCTGLTGVTISDGIASIGVQAFSWCSSLANVAIPGSVTSIGEVAFYYSGLTNVTIPGSVTNLGLGAFAVCSRLTGVTIQDGVTSIGEAGFNFCTNLTGIKIPDSITSIGDRAFWFCTGLTNVTIPSNVTNIGQYAFSACASLTNIDVIAGNPAYSSLDGVLFNKDQTFLIQFPRGRGGSYTVPVSVTDIGSYAFGDYATSGALGYPINLTPVSVYFPGNAPNWDYDFSGFSGTDTLTVYYLPGASGWFLIPFGNAFSALWLPQAQTTDASFGVKTNQFGFNINWASGQTVVVEACTNLSNPDWQPLATNTLASGSAYFSDPQWTNYFTRFYRLTSQ